MSNYRDDRDALRDKADVLAQELEAAKAAIKTQEAELAQNEREVQRLRKLAGERPPPQPGKRLAVLVSVVGAMAVLGGVVSFTLMRASTAPVPVSMPGAPIPVETPTEVARPAEVAPSAEVTQALFTATVKSVVGRSDVKAGQKCEIRVDASGMGTGQRFDELTVRCGDVELHRLTNRGGSVTSMSSWGLARADDAKGRYVLLYEDIGARSSDARAQISLSSEQGAGRVFTEGAVRTEVVLALDKHGKRRTEKGDTR